LSSTYSERSLLLLQESIPNPGDYKTLLYEKHMLLWPQEGKMLLNMRFQILLLKHPSWLDTHLLHSEICSNSDWVPKGLSAQRASHQINAYLVTNSSSGPKPFCALVSSDDLNRGKSPGDPFHTSWRQLNLLQC
jgi:hypothetical protein